MTVVTATTPTRSVAALGLADLGLSRALRAEPAG